MAWLAEYGYVGVDEAAVPPAVLEAIPEEDLVDDYLTIERVAPGALWFEGRIGPLQVPSAASALAKPGWSLYAVLVRHRARWLLLEVGSVYPW